MTASALYVGRVAHWRLAPKDHRLSYAVFQLLLDLDEIPDLGRSLRVFSRNRFNLLSHHDRDHGNGQTGGLRRWAKTVLAEAGIAANWGRIRLLAMPRVLGFVFNPLSLYYCHDTDDRLRAVIYEVNNTFGERHHYVLPVDESGAGAIRQACDKAFRVSPFMPMDLGYVFHLSQTEDAIRTAIDVRDAKGGLVMTASFTGARRDLTDQNLLAAFGRIPLLTLKVVAAIHVEALKLWLKGVAPGPDGVTNGPSRESTAAP